MIIGQSPEKVKLEGKRVIFVFFNLNLGGAERQGLMLARHLQTVEKAQVQVWGFDGPGQVAELCEKHGIPWKVVRVDCSSRLLLLEGLLKLAVQLRSAHPDVLLPYFTLPNVLCGTVWRWTGARACIWQQRDAGTMRGPRRLEGRSVRSVSAFVANSSASRDFLVQVLRVPEAELHIIHNGVALEPPAQGREAWRRQLGLSEHALAACMLANVQPFKDHDTLLRAWRSVVDRRAQAQPTPALLLAGRLEAGADKVKALISELRLDDSVRLLGPVEDIAGLLAAADLGVFSSRSEGCPNGVLECMASGLAVAATDIPGVREAVGEEGFPFLAPPGDAAALADRIRQLLENPALRSQLGQSGRLRIEREFSPERMCRQTVAVMLSSMMASRS